MFSAIKVSDAGVNPVGSTFNIQNSIPHKSQKTKAMAEINRPIEFQRGTVGATESAKEDARPLTEGSDIGLGYFDTGPKRASGFDGLSTGNPGRLFWDQGDGATSRAGRLHHDVSGL